MVDVLLIVDGASEPAGDAQTSLEQARTPALDRLCREGRVTRVRTVADGLPAGSESAIPALLGWRPSARVDRGAIEAAAHGVEMAAGERAWRLDALQGDERAAEMRARELVAELAAELSEHRVTHLGDHRVLVVGRPPLPAQRLGAAFRVWPEGVRPPRVLAADTIVIGARGAAVGVAALMGATTLVPPGATGRLDSDFAAKAICARAAIAGGVRRVVVHVGAADDAAHRRDRGAKVRALERVDAEIVVPLAAAVGERGGVLRVCSDHGCDPATGSHDAEPVPFLSWEAHKSLRWQRGGREQQPEHDSLRAQRRLCERDIAALPVLELAEAVGSAPA